RPRGRRPSRSGCPPSARPAWRVGGLGSVDLLKPVQDRGDLPSHALQAITATEDPKLARQRPHAVAERGCRVAPDGLVAEHARLPAERVGEVADAPPFESEPVLTQLEGGRENREVAPGHALTPPSVSCFRSVALLCSVCHSSVESRAGAASN